MADPIVSHRWLQHVDEEAARAIVALVDFTVGDGGTLGFARPMSVTEAQGFITNLRRRVEAGESHVLLGSVGMRPAFLAVLTVNSMVNCRHRAELGKGVVHPEFRGRHLVELGFRQIVMRAEALGTEQLVLDVREGSRAHALWQRFGFETYGILEDYARVGDVCHRGHFMVQSVASLRKRVWPESVHSIRRKDGVHA